MPTDINNTAVRLPTQCPTDEAIAALTPATGLISITIPAPNNNNDSLDEEEEEEEEGEEEEAGPSTVAIAQKSNTRKRKGPADTIETPSKMKRAFSKKELRKKMNDEDLLIEFEELVENAATLETCKGGDCTCLHVLRDPKLASPVAQYLFDLEREKSKSEVNQIVCDWYKYANDYPRYGEKKRTGILYLSMVPLPMKTVKMLPLWRHQKFAPKHCMS